jgi:hypothetical protein
LAPIERIGGLGEKVVDHQFQIVAAQQPVRAAPDQAEKVASPKKRVVGVGVDAGAVEDACRIARSAVGDLAPELNTDLAGWREAIVRERMLDGEKLKVVRRLLVTERSVKLPYFYLSQGSWAPGDISVGRMTVQAGTFVERTSEFQLHAKIKIFVDAPAEAHARASQINAIMTAGETLVRSIKRLGRNLNDAADGEAQRGTGGPEHGRPGGRKRSGFAAKTYILVAQKFQLTLELVEPLLDGCG